MRQAVSTLERCHSSRGSSRIDFPLLRSDHIRPPPGPLPTPKTRTLPPLFLFLLGFASPRSSRIHRQLLPIHALRNLDLPVDFLISNLIQSLRPAPPSASAVRAVLHSQAIVQPRAPLRYKVDRPPKILMMHFARRIISSTGSRRAATTFRTSPSTGIARTSPRAMAAVQSPQSASFSSNGALKQEPQRQTETLASPINLPKWYCTYSTQSDNPRALHLTNAMPLNTQAKRKLAPPQAARQQLLRLQ